MKTNFNQTVGTGSPGKVAAILWLLLAPLLGVAARHRRFPHRP